MVENHVNPEKKTVYYAGKRQKALPAKRAAYQRSRRKRNPVYSGRRKNTRNQPSGTSRSRRRWRQIVISGVILVAVIGLKLTAPAALEPFRQQVLHLMGQETDFVAAFSAVGRAIGGEDSVKDALGDACVAVFGTQDIKNGGESVYTAATIPENVSLFQQVLGFPYVAPLSGTVASGFGYRIHPVMGGTQFHYGVDIDAPEGTAVRCFADGTVGVVGESTLLGKYVTIHHQNGFSTLYGHCSQVAVTSGQKIHAADPVAEVGNTGESTGPHLHFELCRDGVYLNPVYYV